MENEQSSLPGEFRVFAITRNCLSDPPLKRDMGEPVEFDDLVKAIHHMEELRKKSPRSFFVRQHKRIIKEAELAKKSGIKITMDDNDKKYSAMIQSDEANRRILEFHIEEKIDGEWKTIEPDRLESAREIIHRMNEQRERRQTEWVNLVERYGLQGAYDYRDLHERL